jgi:glutamate synthase domain-containing protein 2
MKSTFEIDLEKISKTANIGVVLMMGFFGVLGHFISFYFHFLTVTFFMLTVLNFYWRHGQRSHALLANFGFLAQIRYLVESIGPEMRQYLFASDTEERPFSRVERAEVYQKAKGLDSSSSFGSLLEFDRTEVKLRHSFFPAEESQLQPFDIAVGAARDLPTTYHIKHPIMISAMSFGALGQNAVRALARGAKLAGAVMNTGEGGYPKYHLMEGCDLIFQMGTAKFGVRTEDGHLDEQKLSEIASLETVKMIEIKLSQGAKPGKGGLLPKEKITPEIAELRGVPMDKDIVSPAHHIECTDAASTVAFIGRIQEISGLPTGIKFCLGHPAEFLELTREMKRQNIVPDYVSVDGSEGGTGAAPKSFMDNIGLPLFEALPLVDTILKEQQLREKLVVFAAGKLIGSGKQLTALSMGADVLYTARGFLLALGCIQALQCNQNTCPTGITTHQPQLQKGLDIALKARRVATYIQAIHHEHMEMLVAMGKTSSANLSVDNVYFPTPPTALTIERELP